MRRREFVGFLGGAMVWPIAGGAQQGERLRRIGVLMNFSEHDQVTRQLLEAFRTGLEHAGWREGQNVRTHYRWDIRDQETAQNYALDLIRLKPDVILSSGTVSLAALKRVNQEVPTVFVLVTDPVAQGFVSTLARPGGLVTGFTSLEFSIVGKWLEYHRELLPDLTRIGLLYGHEVNPYAAPLLEALRSAASPIGIDARTIAAKTEREIEPAIRDLISEPRSSMVVLQDAFTLRHRAKIVDSANHNRVRAIYPTPVFVHQGGLISYGPDLSDHFWRAAQYVDRVLRGEKPADMPVEGPTKFELRINNKTAKKFGVPIPEGLLARADEVIE